MRPWTGALDRADDAPADHERAHVAACRQRLLQVVDGPLEPQRVEDAVCDVGVVDAGHPGAHRAEQRLDDHVAAELLEPGERILGTLAGDRARRRHPGPGEQRRGEELVDRALERSRAVEARHVKRVQRVDAEDDLLERAAWDAADDHRVAVVELPDRDPAVDPPDHPRDRHEPVPVPARLECAGELPRVPAAARSQDRDGQPQNERSRTSRLTLPASKLRPLATLVSRICPGLKSSGSIL
jgi:hypothetical protein